MTADLPPPGRGTLVLIVGPSGVGKDSLIAWCRDRLAGDQGFVFPRRVVTRPSASGREDHATLSEAAFARAASAGAFALHWQAHGLGYGIPASVRDDIAAGRHVVVNVSRSVVPAARAAFDPLSVVSVAAPAGIVASRLAARGGETGAAIRARLERGAALPLAGDDVVVLDNSGPIAEGGAALLRLLRGLGPASGS